ncbi:MAG TPA: phosphonate C-P lyase system protein PhnG [Eoetvoesiella sp.]
MISSVDVKSRQQWMSVLACAGQDLLSYGEALKDADYRFIRPPEVGMALVRGRAGATGSPFNLGEMTVTRCVVQFADGRTGYSYVAGRDKQHAELAALADAHLQGDCRQQWLDRVIDPLRQVADRRRAFAAARTATSKVDFLTLVRGED